MQKIFEFKSKCIETEDLLTPFLKEAKITDLFEITKNGLQTENAGNKVCRLCMNITEDKRKLNSNEQTMFQTFFPEIVSIRKNLFTISNYAVLVTFFKG